MTTTPTSARFHDALTFAAEIHSYDTRKGTQIPYISHLLSVCALVMKDGGSEDEAIAALLHDVLEDHPESVSAEDIETRFGFQVRSIVEACTDTPAESRGGPMLPWMERMEAYVAHLAGPDSPSLRVSVADKLDNARAILRDLRVHGDTLWERFNAGRDDQLWFYRAVITAARTGGARGALIDELDRTVTAIEALATSPTPDEDSRCLS